MQTWSIQDAKARFSELVKLSESDGPQDITLHGRSVAVVVSRATFEQLSGANQSLVAFMRASPLYKLEGLEDIKLERDKDRKSVV